MGRHKGVQDLHGVLAESCEQRGILTKPLPAANGRHNGDNEPYEPHWIVPFTAEEEAEEND